MRCVPTAMTLRRVGVIAAGGLVVVACANPFAEDAPTLSDILGSGWVGPGIEPASTPTAQAPLYCYGTIGREDCYEAPLPTEGGRLVGFQGPPPPTRDDL